MKNIATWWQTQVNPHRTVIRAAEAERQLMFIIATAIALLQLF
jgi:hypothetical protein